MEIIQLENVTFTYEEASTPSLNEIHMSVKKGDFVVLCGPSGCGKSTLLRLLKRELTPIGTYEGNIFYKGRKMSDYDEMQLVEQIAIVMQDPDYQIVFDDVMQELVFALENIGLSVEEMKKRVAELVHYFSAEDLLQMKPSNMSGGQKQTVNLLSALLLKPDVLLLDEPTAQLDPIAAKKFLTILKELNEETGMTIIIAEHHVDHLYAIADEVVVMKHGSIVLQGNSKEVVSHLLQTEGNLKSYVPETIQFLSKIKLINSESIPFTLKESKKLLAKYLFESYIQHEEEIQRPSIIKCNELYVQYEKNKPYVLKKLNVDINEGEIFALLGGNGSGKSTWLKALIGEVAAIRGKITICHQKLSKIKIKQLTELVHYLPQNPKMYFSHDTIEDEMQNLIAQYNIQDEYLIESLLKKFHIEHLRNRHPQDCSGGELQRAALACIQIGDPKILLLDEPTKGLDPINKQYLTAILRELSTRSTIVFVTHDVEFAANCATRAGILFNGEITSIGPTKAVLSNNFFYTTALNRLTKREQFEGILTLKEAGQLKYEITNK